MTDDTTNSIPLKRCSKCGIEKPATTEYFKKGDPYHYSFGVRGVCKDCESNAAKERRKNPEFQQREREYRERNKERIQAHNRRRYEANRQKAIDDARAWRIENRDRYNAWGREYTKRPEVRIKRREIYKRRDQSPERREKMRLYRQWHYAKNIKQARERAKIAQRARRKDPVTGARIRLADNARFKTPKRQLSHKAYHQRRRARKQNLPDNLTVDQWNNCLAYFNHRCAVCGKPQGLWHVIAMDHWIPLSSPDCPGTIAGNVIPLCHSRKGGEGGCNNSKLDKHPETWLIEQVGKKKAFKILSQINDYFVSLKGGA